MSGLYYGILFVRPTKAFLQLEMIQPAFPKIAKFRYSVQGAQLFSFLFVTGWVLREMISTRVITSLVSTSLICWKCHK